MTTTATDLARELRISATDVYELLGQLVSIDGLAAVYVDHDELGPTGDTITDAAADAIRADLAARTGCLG